MRKGVGERRRGAREWISVPPVHPFCYGTAFLRLTPSYLDEFMWQDRFGRTYQDCFDNIQRHIAQFYPVQRPVYIFNHRPFPGPPILFKKKLNYVLLCFIKLRFKPKCHGIDTIMYNSLIPFVNFGSSQYSILKLIAIYTIWYAHTSFLLYIT